MACFISDDLNWEPWSDRISSGILNLVNTVQKTSATVSASMLLSGIASGNCDAKSIIVAVAQCCSPQRSNYIHMQPLARMALQWPAGAAREPSCCLCPLVGRLHSTGTLSSAHPLAFLAGSTALARCVLHIPLHSWQRESRRKLRR